ncbi:restriction endonuclease subunit S [Flavobacterium alvei]|uniref:Restriction endonuclease subunit S n=1 Tax=Flavobacterium alvei TaxID=2080416 RepID=A0A2S5AD95_9FLAO|nr:restriction endonuclease subunit S [Flavobacterium alvei]POY40550.1 restriction endonuclease subunit S [Flavobacterium alvei]
MKSLLKEFSSIHSGNSAPDKSLFSKKGKPFIRARSLEFLVRGLPLEDCERIDDLIAKEKGLKLYPKNSIIFAKSGMSSKMGRVYILPSEAYIVSHLAIIIVDENIVNPLFIKYYFSYRPPFHLIKDDAYPSISLKDIGNIEISIPKAEIQDRIIAILEKGKYLREKREKSILLFEKLLRATFLNMFGDPVQNERKWNKKQLKEFGEIITGNTPPRANKEFYNDNFIEWIKTNNIIRESLFLSKAEEYLSEKGFKVSRYVNENALLVTCIAGSLSSIGRSAISDRKVAFNQQINAIVPNKEVSVYFLYWMIKISDEYIHSFATKGMKRLITKGVFEQIEFIKPDYNLQKDFEKVAINANNLLSKLMQSKTQLENLLNGLSQSAFNGDLEFNTAVDLEVLLENNYSYFKDNADKKAIQLLLDRLDKNELNENKFYEEHLYDKAKSFVFELLKDEKIKQVYEKEQVKLVVI